MCQPLDPLQQDRRADRLGEDVVNAAIAPQSQVVATHARRDGDHGNSAIKIQRARPNPARQFIAVIGRRARVGQNQVDALRAENPLGVDGGGCCHDTAKSDNGGYVFQDAARLMIVVDD